MPLDLSTIVISEFHVGQDVGTLPLHNFVVLPFNVDHAVQAGTMFRWLKEAGTDWQGQRGAVKDDLKLIAQATVRERPVHVARR